MKILNIYIEDFGCLSDRRISLSDGFNLISGENESGKSTIISFIKFVLYGLPRKNAENVAERSRAISLKTGLAAGSIELEHEGKNYTVYRRVIHHTSEKRDTYSEDCRIIDGDTGIQVHKGEVPGELFLGVPCPVYESICFIRQSGAGDIRFSDVNRAIENMLISADESVNLKKTLERLEGAKKIYLHKNGRGGSLYELENELSDLDLRLAKSMEEYNRIIARNEAIEELRQSISDKRAELDRVDNLLSALSLASVVKSFDRLHETERTLSKAESDLRKFRSDSTSPQGIIPDRGFISALSEAIAAKNNALSVLNGAKEEMAKEIKIRDDFAVTIDTAFDEKLRRINTPTSIYEEVKRSMSDAASKRKEAKFLFAASGVFAIAGIALGLLVSPILYSISALSIISALPAFLNLKRAKSLENNADATLLEYGVSNEWGDICERNEKLSDIIRRHLDSLSRLSSLDHSVTLAQSVCALRSSDLEICEKSISALTSKWNGGESDPDAVLSNATKVCNRISEFEEEINHLARLVSQLTEELSEYNERMIRGRVPEELVSNFSSVDHSELERKKKFFTQTIRMLSEKLSENERELIKLETGTENPNRISSSIEDAKERHAAEKLTFDALSMAYEALFEAGNDIRSGVTPIIRSRASRYMSMITDEKYSALGIGENYEMTADTDYGNRELYILSAGTRDAAYISLRLSLLSLIWDKNLPPLTVDEALSQLDNTRASNALRILLEYCRLGGQCILFTCHDREKNLLSKLENVEVNSISLTKSPE